MNSNLSSENFIQQNSPDGGFLQSSEWRKFQESFGHRIFHVEGDNFYANIIEHELPIVGKYFYIPRGPIGEGKIREVIELAKKENVGWIRIDVGYKNSSYKIVKAPHDMQPREIFVVDVAKSEEQLLAEMKSKTRYNIKLAQKHGVKTWSVERGVHNEKYFDKFLELTKVTAKRDGITPHPEIYYRKMFEVVSGGNLKLYVAEYEDKIIVANLVAFYGNTATYLHGSSDNEYRNVMAAYLLQWQQIQDAKKAGCTKYDLGGIKSDDGSSWAGITKFKTGFSPETKPTEFFGSYDIVVNSFKYSLYRVLQKIKSVL